MRSRGTFLQFFLLCLSGIFLHLLTRPPTILAGVFIVCFGKKPELAVRPEAFLLVGGFLLKQAELFLLYRTGDSFFPMHQTAVQIGQKGGWLSGSC